jgi:hypothetical protein
MAAIYDALGNVVGDDSAPSLDQMNLALTKSNRLTPQQMERFVAPPPLASQISGYDKPVPPAQTPPATNPLEFAAGNFTQLATNFNPLMMMKSMKEAAGILTVPPVAAIKGVGESLFASPPGTYTSGKAPDYAEKVAKQFMEQNAPQTPVTQAFANAISPLVADLPAYLGHLQTGRPALTPNDVRVMGAEATRMGRQVRDIPTDFANAQSGMQKIDPITGQPTIGARFGQAERNVTQAGMQFEKSLDPVVQDIMARGGTSADILAAMAGQPLYAMRPEGSRIQNAVVPSTAASGAATYTPVQDLISDFVKTEPLTPVEVLDEVQNNILSRERAQPARDAFTNFLKQTANEMYPDAPSESAALAAYKMKFGNKAASAPNTLDLYYQFLQTPEGIQYRAQYNLPSPDEVAARHDAASQWLQSQFANYINEKVGTPNEPAAKLASQGFTFAKPEDVLESSQLSTQNLEAKRIQAGMPPSTEIDLARNEASQKLAELTRASANAERNKREQQAAAIAQGYGAVDPNTGLVAEGMNIGRYEPFAQASREASKAATALAKQQQKYDNLNLGAAYERATDIAVNATTAKDLKEGLEFREQQFYPSLMRTPDDERVYTASVNQLKNLGFDELAKNFYNDVMSGAIPLDKVPKMTVENYIRQVAEKRIASERIAKEQTAKYVSDVNDKFLDTTNKYIPLDKTYRNVGALEITNKFKPEEVGRLVSEDTIALDVCIGEGGSAVDTPNYWHLGTGNRQYEPIYNILTGERNPKATSPRMTFINAVKKGDQMISFRDLATGVPAAIFQFEKVSPNKFQVGFASGRGNQFVQPQYVDGIKDYLNSRSDQIVSTSSNLERNLGVYDRERINASTLAQAANVSTSEFRSFDLSSLPRFVTKTDLQDFVANLPSNAPQQAAVPAVADQRPSRSLESFVTSSVSGAFDNVLEAQRRLFEEEEISDRFQRSEDTFADIRAQFNERMRDYDPVTALDMTIQELMTLEGQYGNSARPSYQIISQGIIDLMQTLDQTAEYARLRVAADAVQTPHAVGQNGRVQYLRMTHDAFMQAERQYGIEAADEMRSTVRSIIEQQGFDPQTDTDRFITSLRVAADDADRGTVEIALSELADQMESAYIQDWEPDVAHAANAPAQQPAPVNVDRIRNYLSDQTSQIYSEMDRDGVAGLTPLVSDVLTPLMNSYVYNDRFFNIPVERLQALLRELGQQIELLEMQGEYERAAASRLSDFHNAIEYALQDLQRPAPAPQAQNIVPRGNDIDPEELRDAFLSGARIRLDDRNYEIVRDHVQGIGQYINSRDEPEEFASMVRQAADMVLDVNARDLLQSYANQIENLYGPPIRAAEEFIPATQDQMQGIGQAIDNVLNRQLQRLRDTGNNGAADIFVATYPILLRENNLDGMLIEEGDPANFGRALQGFSDDLTAQLPNLRTGGDQHRAAALAMENVIETISNFLPYLRNEPENLNQAQIEQSLISDVRALLDNPDLNPEDLRAVASDMEPFANNPNWYALSEQTRRTAMRQLRERANYIEFSPADFAIRLSNEAGTDIPELRDTVQALNDGTFDHEILRGLPAIERDRAAQRTALNLNHILQGMQADAQLRALNPNGVPPAPAPRAITRQQQAIIDRVPQITDMLIDFSVDDPIETAADYRRIANILRDRRNAREFLEDVMDVGSSLGDFTLRASDLRSSTLSLIADELESRAANMAVPDGPLMTDNELYNSFTDIIRAAIRDEDFDPANYSNADLAMLVADDQIGGLDDLTPEQRARLAMIVRDRGFEDDDYANGGPVRGYKKGGSVKKDDVQTPSLFGVSDYSNFTAKDMYPGKVGIDDQRDAARHMLAAGTLARKYNPWIAEKLGQAHEFKSAPIQHIKSLFGAEMPPDYYMDRHNNEVGSRLGRQARSQSELEDLVQAEAERASRTKTPGQAFILKANGGIVQQNPTTDQMRYELMMRRK